MNDEHELIQVGDFELDQSQLFLITRSYLAGESVDDISARLDIDSDDLVELLGHPEVFKQAVEARKNLLHLMVLGPIADRMITIAATADARSAATAAKFLRDISAPAVDKEEQRGVATTVTNNTLNVIGQMPVGGFESVIRQVEGAQDQNVLDAAYEVTT